MTTNLTDEFALESTSADDGANPRRTVGRSPRRGGSAPWIGIAILAIVLGVTAAPTTASSRAVEPILGWAGLGSFVVMEADRGADVIALARDAVERISMTVVESTDPRIAVGHGVDDETTMGVVVLVVPDSVEPINDVLYDVPMPSPETIAMLETLAPGEDWVCQTDAAARTTCTSLRDGVVLLFDEPIGP